MTRLAHAGFGAKLLLAALAASAPASATGDPARVVDGSGSGDEGAWIEIETIELTPDRPTVELLLPPSRVKPGPMPAYSPLHGVVVAPIDVAPSDVAPNDAAPNDAPAAED